MRSPERHFLEALPGALLLRDTFSQSSSLNEEGHALFRLLGLVLDLERRECIEDLTLGLMKKR
jgi:hypothetical protein